MNPTREEALFALALGTPPEKRVALLDVVCEGDPSVRARIEALLAAHDGTGGILAADSMPEELTPTLELPEPVADEAVGQTLGRYKLLERVGEGGCGVVYVAEQTEPVRRRVALKVIKLGMDTKQVVARFEAERQALALMDHPNIAKVLDAGTTELGRPYFVMELVRGIKITDYCDQGNLTTKDRLDLFIKVCQAIQHAHQKGIIHRDIKPSNILVTLHDGVPVPKVIDFGIAKATEGRLTDVTIYTQLHQFIGTPAYMSPEQAEMSGLDIDTRSDIYSLGVLLYQLLTGKTPFDGKELQSMGLDAMRRTIREMEPPRPSTRVATLRGEELTTTAKRRSADAPRLIHLLQGDLDWIVMKCLEKDRQRRYETANGLAADIRRHLANEPVVACPPSAAYKMQKAFRRNKLAFSAATAVALALVVGISGSTWQAIRANREAARAVVAEGQKDGLLMAANQAKANEESQRRLAETAVTRLEIDRAEMLFEKGKASEALAYLAKVVRREPTNRVAGERILSALAQRGFGVPLFRIDPGTRTPITVELGEDGQRVLIVTKEDGAEIYDGRTGRPVVGSFARDSRMLAAGFYQSGTRVLTVHEGNSTQIWDAQSGQLAGPPIQHESRVLKADISPDGKHLLTGSIDGRVRQWDIQTGARVGPEIQLKQSVSGLNLSPDGRWIVAVTRATNSSECFLINAADGAVTTLYDRFDGDILPKFNADGTRLFVSPSAGDFEIRVPGLGATNRIKPASPSAYNLIAAQFSPDGQTMALSLYESFATLLETATLRPIGERLRHEHWVLALAFSPDGQRIATGSKDRTVRIWDARTGRPLSEPLRHDAPVVSVRFSADGQRLLSQCDGGAVWGWEIRDAQPLAAVLQHSSDVRQAVFSPDGRSAATSTVWSENVRLWDVSRATSLRPPLGIGSFEIAFSPDGRKLLGNNSRTAVSVWDSVTGEPAGKPIAGNFSYARFNPDGQLVVTGGRGVTTPAFSPNDHIVKVWRIADASLVAQLPQEGGAGFARFSPDGRWIVTAAGDKTARIWDWQTGRELTPPLRHEGPIFWMDVSADSRRVLTLTKDQAARIWEADSGKLLHTFSHDGEPYHSHSAQFSADGRLAVIASGSKVQVFDAHTGKSMTAALTHVGRVNSVKFSPDGRRLVTSCHDGAVRLWDTATGHQLSEPLQHADRVNYAEFSPDGRWVITASRDGTSRIYEVPILSSTVPAVVADLAEAVAGLRLDDRWGSQPVPYAELHRLRQGVIETTPEDEVTRWAKWYFAENAVRRISPGANLTVPQLAQQRVEANTVDSLQQALALSPNHGLALARLAFLTLTNTPMTSSGLVASLEWQSQRGVELSPGSPDVWRSRAQFLDHLGNAAQAIDTMARAISLSPTTANLWNEQGLRLERAGRPENALQHYTKAIEHSGPWKDTQSLPAEAYRNRRDLNRRLNRSAEATADHLKYLNLRPRDPDTPARLIDLSPFYTSGTDIRLQTGNGHNFSELPSGRQKLGGEAEFDLRGVIQAVQTKTGSSGPTGIGIQQKGRRLHFLHVGVGRKPEDGKAIGIYRLHYADGQQTEIPIRYGEQLRDQNPAWDTSEVLAPNTRLAWIGDTPVGSRIRLFETVWNNDHPDTAIVSLDVITQSTDAELLLFAITVEQ